MLRPQSRTRTFMSTRPRFSRFPTRTRALVDGVAAAGSPGLSGRTARARTAATQAFTLFEVAISLLIVSIGVVSVLMVFPVGIRQQQQVRYQLLASATALSLVDKFNNQENINTISQYEQAQPWEGGGFCYSNTRFDLESVVSRRNSGVCPLPLEIARRLDSDGDELQRVLDAGGNVYYLDAATIPSVGAFFPVSSPAMETQKLVFAVVGSAQNNAISVFPYKAWPYRVGYPSGPFIHGNPNAGGTDGILHEEKWSGNGFPGNGIQTPDPAMVTLYTCFDNYIDSPLIKNERIHNTIITNEDNAKKADIERNTLAQGVFDFCKAKFSPGIIDNPMRNVSVDEEFRRFIEIRLGPEDVAPMINLGNDYDRAFSELCNQAETDLADQAGLSNVKAKRRAEIALRVQCFRFLAMAMATYNTYVTSERGEVGNRERGTGRCGSLPARMSLADPIGPGIVPSAALLRYFFDRSLACCMRYAASFPYDWGAPRSNFRAIMMDNPLFEFDLFTKPISGKISGTSPSVMAAMWHPLIAQALTSPGLPSTYPGVQDLSTGIFNKTLTPFPAWNNRDGSTSSSGTQTDALWGRPTHFTLCKKFDAAERCRQLVFWAVDWQSYEDAETAPSAPMDASRVPIYMATNQLSPLPYEDTRTYKSLLGLDDLKMGGASFGGFSGDRELSFIGNPEWRRLFFDSAVKDLPTNSVVGEYTIDDASNPALKSKMPSGCGNPEAKKIFLGHYGADRNGNGMLNRGRLDKAQRLRAAAVARFNFYDPRLPISLR